MLRITYGQLVLGITLVWLLVRAVCAVCRKQINPKREGQLLFVYVCLVVVARFTFFPFSTVNGEIQPLVLDVAKIFPFRLNLIPLVHLFDYPTMSDVLVNVIGNTAMFIPLGIVWPTVFKQLNTHGKTIAAGVGITFAIEILQLPFYDRVSDVDDLLLNSVGFLIGYAVLLLFRLCRRNVKGNI